MSGYLAGKVWLSGLDAELKPLAATLADLGNDDGTSIYPSIAYICWRLGRSHGNVLHGLKELRKAKILKVVRKGGGRGLSTIYKLDAAALPHRPSWSETRKGPEIDLLEETVQSGEETVQSVSETPPRVDQDSSLPVSEEPSNIRLPLPKPEKRKKEKSKPMRSFRSLNDFPSERQVRTLAAVAVLNEPTPRVRNKTVQELWMACRELYKETVRGDSLGSLGRETGEMWLTACESNGTDAVWNGFKAWLEEEKGFLKTVRSPAARFVYKIDEWIAEAKIVAPIITEDPNAGLGLTQAGAEVLKRYSK